MSKLDRFLIYENLMITCPNFTATSLERYLSDHRPILLRESHFDYGPTPFRFFHSWFEMEGFNKLVEDAWNEAPMDESNAMSNMMKKLKYLKQKIRDWNKGNMKSSKNIKAKFKDDLKAVDDIIDNGEGNDEVVKLRMDVLKSIQDIDKIQSLDVAQKAKIKWSIEGDENSSFYHGVLNKKRSQLNIHGILVDGTWVDNPQRFESGCSMARIQARNEVVTSVCSALSKWKLRRFQLEKRTSWVKWKNVLGSKIKKGGLGVSSLYALNRGLMFKWVWRFFTQNTSLWSRVIKAIHGEDGKVGKQVKSTFPSYWMDIVHEINVLKNQGINLLNCMQMKLGNGDKTAF
ncbi:hypothetical protein Tco_0324465 [Tanacetum coccineum]